MAALLGPLLSTMSVAARTAWPFIQRGVADGMTANAIQDALTGGGVGIRRQDLLSLVREAREAVLLRSDLERLPRDVVLPASRVREAVTRVVAPFSYVLEVELLNEATGTVTTRRLTAHSSELRAVGEVEQELVDQQVMGDSVPGELIVGARVTDVLRSGSAGVI